jgi:branched-subunit amino acid ABC-type transport system permease component
MSLGIGMILTEALSHGFNSGRPVSFGDAIPLGAPLLRVGLIVFLDSQLCVIAVATLAVIAFFLLLYRSGAGRAFRAIAEDPVGARLAGIPIRRTGMASFALAGVMGGVTAVLMAMLLGSAFPRLGEQVALKVLAISIIAGMGHLAGGLAVGLLLGILEAVVQGYVGGSWSNAIAFAALLAVMLTRPKGLFGSRV